jgi:hypothetical protein
MDLLTARTANEQAQASLRAAGEVLQASRKHGHETTEMLRKKNGGGRSPPSPGPQKKGDKERAIKGPIRRVSLLVSS